MGRMKGVRGIRFRSARDWQGWGSESPEDPVVVGRLKLFLTPHPSSVGQNWSLGVGG